MTAYPKLERLDALLAGTETHALVQPPIPKCNPRHDLYGPRPHEPLDIRSALGEENFTPPPPVPKDTKMYTIGELGKILGRKAGTMRMWVRTGVLPEATRWTGGTGIGRKRLYTPEQVMGLMSIASTEGLMVTPCRAIRSTAFTRRATELFRDCP